MDLRCKNCNRKLAVVEVIVAAIKCPSCKMIFEYKVMSNSLYISSDYDKNNSRTQEVEEVVPTPTSRSMGSF